MQNVNCIYGIYLVILYKVPVFSSENCRKILVYVTPQLTIKGTAVDSLDPENVDTDFLLIAFLLLNRYN